MQTDSTQSVMQFKLGQAAFERGYSDHQKGRHDNPYHQKTQGFLHSRWAVGHKCAEDEQEFIAAQRGDAT